MFKNLEDIVDKASNRKLFDTMCDTDRDTITKVKEETQEGLTDKMVTNNIVMAGLSFLIGMAFLASLTQLTGWHRVVICVGALLLEIPVVGLVNIALKELVLVYGLAEAFFLSVLVVNRIEDETPEQLDEPEQSGSTENTQPGPTELH